MINRRTAPAGLTPSTSCRTFGATGGTGYLSNEGTLEPGARASPKTKKLNARTADTGTVDESERIVI